MNGRATTVDAPSDPSDETGSPVPVAGVVVFAPLGSSSSTSLRVVVVPRRSAVIFGRGADADVALDDEQLSRRHLSIAFEGQSFVVHDLQSRNGSLLDGQRVTGPTRCAAGRVVRFGSHLALVLSDVAPLLGGEIAIEDGAVVGPQLAAVFATLTRLGNTSSTAFIGGESGSGKELAARRFHRAAAPASAPFVPVNCAAVPPALSERLFFGVKRGAYSGADADAEGYVQVASGGTLFLDELAELDLAVQAKLLRTLESGEVYRLGATRGDTVKLKICSATHRDLRAEVAAGRFRQDLYHRLARPGVRLPPLRERPEEIPAMIEMVASQVSPELRVHPDFVAACLVRAWPGNVRELLASVRDAAGTAASQGASMLRDKHLDEEAGAPIDAGESIDGARPGAKLPADALIERALETAAGNASAAARALGVHRTQLRRWIARREPKG